MKNYILLIITCLCVSCIGKPKATEQTEIVSTVTEEMKSEKVSNTPKLDIDILLDNHLTTYTQVILKEQIKGFKTVQMPIIRTAIMERDTSLINDIYTEIDSLMNFKSLFLTSTGYKWNNNIMTKYAFDIMTLDIVTGLIWLKGLELSRADQGAANWFIMEVERNLMNKYYNLLYDKIKNFHHNRDPNIIKPSKVHLLLEKNQKQWEQLQKQNEELFWECLEHAEGNWASVSYPALGYYRERISFLFDCYVNYNQTTRYNYHIID